MVGIDEPLVLANEVELKVTYADGTVSHFVLRGDPKAGGLKVKGEVINSEPSPIALDRHFLYDIGFYPTFSLIVLTNGSEMSIEKVER